METLCVVLARLLWLWKHLGIAGPRSWSWEATSGSAVEAVHWVETKH